MGEEIYHWKSMSGVRVTLSIGQDNNIGNVCGTGLAPASSLHRVPCVYYD